MNSEPSESKPAPPLEQWIQNARSGSGEAIGQVLEWCRPYLLRVANQEIQPELRAKLGASDLVQETFLEAQRDFAHFRGRTEEDILAWLRRMLLNNLANFTRQFYGTDKRQLQREVALADVPLQELQKEVASDSDSPRRQTIARERDEALHRALAQLREDQRLVIHLRNYERYSFDEIGRHMGLPSGEAARKLWGRALDKLKELLEPLDESSGS